jgi:hypothetical protein
VSTPAELHAAVFERLEALPTVAAFDGDVPPNPPADRATGLVYPYAVLWPGPGGDTTDADLVTSGALTWDAQITVAAGDVAWCLGAVNVVRFALRDQWVLDTASPLRDVTPASRTVMRDPDPAPPRWFVPLLFRCQI